MIINEAKKPIIVVTQKRNIMLKACVAIAITNTEGIKNLGTVPMINSMPMECAKIAISTATTAKEGRRKSMRRMMKLNLRVS
jgi:hypothetical protein